MLIILEGADGVGTTTQAALLFKHLLHSYPNTRPVLTAEPSSTPVGHLIRSLLKDAASFSAVEMAALFFVDRKAHFRDIIRPALEKDHWVICDRNWQSSLVYQGLIASLEDTNFVKLLNQQFAIPDSVCYILDVPVAETARRRRARGTHPEAYETDAIQEKVLAAYRRVPEHDPTAVLLSCANKLAVAVHQELVAHLEPFLIA